MILDDKVFEQITADDILALIPEVSESRRIDYKEALPDGNERGVRSFLNDVCAMANSAGGFLVYGIAEARDEENNQTGNPEKVVGIGEVVADQVVQAWQQRITQAIEPRVIGHRIAVISGFPDNASVMLVYVPKSLFAPHRVNYQGKKEFYVRHDKCNLPMDMGEIRHSFVEAKEVPQRIDEYRRLRVSQILADETPIELLRSVPVLVLHFMPLSSFATDAAVDVTSIKQTSMPSIGCDMTSRRLNADGYLFNTGVRQDHYRGYEQVYRDGRIEACFTHARMTVSPDDGVPCIRGRMLEEAIIRSVEANFALLRDLGTQPPVYVGVSLMRMKGIGLTHANAFFMDTDNTIDKDTVMPPTVISETLTEDTGKLVGPIIQAIWQASGAAGSPHYNEDGFWKPS